MACWHNNAYQLRNIPSSCNKGKTCGRQAENIFIGRKNCLTNVNKPLTYLLSESMNEWNICKGFSKHIQGSCELLTCIPLSIPSMSSNCCWNLRGASCLNLIGWIGSYSNEFTHIKLFTGKVPPMLCNGMCFLKGYLTNNDKYGPKVWVPGCYAFKWNVLVYHNYYLIITYCSM